MKTLKEEAKYHCAADELWNILSDVGRCDWVPTIEEIALEGNCRHFEMAGMGQITEQILINNDEDMILQYSAINTPVPIKHHLATIQISAISAKECMLTWTTEISPDIFAGAIHQGMLVSIEGIKKVI